MLQVSSLTLHASVTINLELTHSWSWALFEKLPIVQLLKNFPAFYGNRRFISVFKRALQWSRFWARSILSIPPHPISLRSILILSTYQRLGLPSGLFPSGFPTNILYAFLFNKFRIRLPNFLKLLLKTGNCIVLIEFLYQSSLAGTSDIWGFALNYQILIGAHRSAITQWS
jgi:hypothetical protein